MFVGVAFPLNPRLRSSGIATHVNTPARNPLAFPFCQITRPMVTSTMRRRLGLFVCAFALIIVLVPAAQHSTLVLAPRHTPAAVSKILHERFNSLVDYIYDKSILPPDQQKKEKSEASVFGGYAN